MPSVRPGNQLDHFAIDVLVARTDTASIFRATDLRTLRPVALKIPHPEVEGDLLFYQRFQREREICEKLDHPAVIKGFEEKERSQVYIVMELAQGRLLRQEVIDHGKLPVERAVRITLAICEALDYIHAHGVVHRDLKPENVMVGAGDSIKLLDFGIASLTGARRLTFGKLSQVMGTPDYISPEQVKGKRGDARSDIYALGAMLYEMLTGKTPFPGDNPFAIMRSRLANHPMPFHQTGTEISPELQEIVYRALERDPKKRYDNAADFANDLLHRDRARAVERPEPRSWQTLSRSAKGTGLFYPMLAMIPVVIFVLLFYFSRHG